MKTAKNKAYNTEFEYSFVCDQCKKRVEIPFLCDKHYGWFGFERRFCTYSCLRKYEKEHDNVSFMAHKQRDNTSQVHETFRKLKRYSEYRQEGMLKMKAAEKAGFTSYAAATHAIEYYLDTRRYLDWEKSQKDM